MRGCVVNSTEGSFPKLDPLPIQHIQGGVILIGLGLVLPLVKEDKQYFMRVFLDKYLISEP